MSVPEFSFFQHGESPYEIRSVRSEPSQRSAGPGPASSRPISPASAASAVSDREGENNGNPFESNEEEEL